MTSIAWDGRILAADGRCTRGNIISTESFVKLHTSKGRIKDSKVLVYALGGRADMYGRIGQWIDEGCPVTEEFIEMEFEVIIVTEDAVYEYGTGSSDLVGFPSDSLTTLGSGGEFAYSALRMGKNAIEAVQHAASIDLFTGGNGLYMDCRCEKPELKEFKV